MRTSSRPWRAAEQRHLVQALQAGRPPLRVCRQMQRAPDDATGRLTLLLGDVTGHVAADPIAHLDLLWLRLRASPPEPAHPTADDVAALWSTATGVGLDRQERRDLAADPAVGSLAATGRHALVRAAPLVLADAGTLDLDDWLAVARDVNAAAAHPLPSTMDPTWLPAVRRLLAAAVDDIAPQPSRVVMAEHLLRPSPSPFEGADVAGDRGPGHAHDPRTRRAGLLEMVRAASLPGRPASGLRDALAEKGSLGRFVAFLPEPPFALVSSLAVLAGYHPADALRIAGAELTPWHRPPTLGKGFVVSVPRRERSA